MTKRMGDDPKKPTDPNAAAAQTRKAERFERQAQALRENLRRRNRQRRAGAAEAPDKTET